MATTSTPKPKVVASTGGSAVGSSVGIVIVYAFEQLASHDLPVGVEGAIIGICAAIVAFLGGYTQRED